MLQEADGDQVFEAAVYFRPEVDWSFLSASLQPEPSTHSSALIELEVATAAQAKELAAQLSDLDLEVSRIGKTMPVVFVRGTAANLISLQALNELAMILPAEPMVGKSLSCNGGSTKPGCDVDPVVWEQIDAQFNANGFFGEGQRVGIVEVTHDNCTLEDSHEAFAYASFTYSNGSPAGCINDHGAQVASVISGSIGGTQCGASNVDFCYANSGASTYFPDNMVTVTTVGCNPTATLDAYDWFASIGDYQSPLMDPPIAAVNESYGCVRENINCDYSWARPAEGITQDYYARVYGRPIVKAAGNHNDFDLFLHLDGVGYVWGSQSLDDNNEGFDYTVPSGQGGDYHVYLAWPEGLTSCEGTNEEVGAFAWKLNP